MYSSKTRQLKLPGMWRLEIISFPFSYGMLQLNHSHCFLHSLLNVTNGFWKFCSLWFNFVCLIFENASYIKITVTESEET